MYQVVKDIISSVSIEPGSSTESSASEADSSETDLVNSFDSMMNLSSSTTGSLENLSDAKAPNQFPIKIIENHFTPGQTGRRSNPEDQVDEYLSKANESLVRRFYDDAPLSEYTKVRDYDFGHSKLELMSKFRGNTTLKEFVVRGLIDVPMENLLALVMELSNRTKWDDTYLEHAMMSFDEASKTDFIFSVSKYPFPLTKRTYVVTRTCYSYGDDCLVIFSGVTNKMLPPKKMRWATQVDEFESLLVVRNCEPEEVDGVRRVTRSHMLATYFENPKVLLPNSYLNFLIGQLVPGILNKMIIASKTLSYEDSVEYVKGMPLVPIPKD